jgi:hypothetical protein
MKLCAPLFVITLLLQGIHGTLFAGEQEWIRMEPDSVKLPVRENLVWKERAEPTAKHRCVFYLMGKNQAELEKILKEVSDPKSKSYGKHLTKEQIDELTVDKEGTQIACLDTR